MLTEIYYFVDERGRNPVKEFIKSLPVNDRTKILAYLTALYRQGHNLRRPMAGYLGNGLYELRPKNNRIFYFFFMRDSVVLIHVIRKKTDKIPENDCELCLRRKDLVEEGLAQIEKLEFGGN